MERAQAFQRLASRRYKEIYEWIRKQGIVSKTDLLEKSGMTGSTLTRTLEELTTAGLIREAGFGESTGGRRPILYELEAGYAYVFGLEISRLVSRLSLFNLRMDRLDSVQWTMTEQMTPTVLLGRIEEAARAMLARRGLSASDVLGIGVGAVGPLDRSAGTLLQPSYFPASGWRHVNVKDELERRLGVPALLDNGANTALIGEYWADRERDYLHLLYVHVGVGLRSAMMTGGKLVYGAVDMEGSIGQMIIQSDGPRLRETGNYGALESYASIYSLELQAQAKLKQGRDSMLRELEPDPDKIQFAHLVQALQANDPLTVELFTQAATYFGIGLSNLLNILHPEKVILGGTLISSHPAFFHVATRVAIQRTYYYPQYQVVFSQGTLGEDALVTGAALMVIDQWTSA